MSNRPAYLDDKIALEQARREHLKHPPKGCACPLCLSPEEWRKLVEAALARNASAGEEVPF